MNLFFLRPNLHEINVFWFAGFCWNHFGRVKLDYLKKHDYGLYLKLLSKNELNDYLLKVQKEADDLYERLVEEYKIKRDVTEELKQKDQMKWIQMMNNIKSCIDGFILLEFEK